MFRRNIESEGAEHGRRKNNNITLVAMRLWDTPVLIPNTMVKTQAADGTILETVWESRWLPDLNGLIAQPVRAHA